MKDAQLSPDSAHALPASVFFFSGTKLARPPLVRTPTHLRDFFFGKKERGVSSFLPWTSTLFLRWLGLSFSFFFCPSCSMSRRCEYVSRLGVFKNNEHVIVTTIIDLTKAFFGGGGVGGSRGERGPAGGEVPLWGMLAPRSDPESRSLYKAHLLFMWPGRSLLTGAVMLLRCTTLESVSAYTKAAHDTIANGCDECESQDSNLLDLPLCGHAPLLPQNF